MKLRKAVSKFENCFCILHASRVHHSHVSLECPEQILIYKEKPVGKLAYSNRLDDFKQEALFVYIESLSIRDFSDT